MEARHRAEREKQREVDRDRRLDRGCDGEADADHAGAGGGEGCEAPPIGAVDEGAGGNEEQDDGQHLHEADARDDEWIASALVELPQHGRADDGAAERVQGARTDETRDRVAHFRSDASARRGVA